MCAKLCYAAESCFQTALQKLSGHKGMQPAREACSFGEKSGRFAIPASLSWKAGELLQCDASAGSSWQSRSHVANGLRQTWLVAARYIVSQCTVIIHFRMNI